MKTTIFNMLTENTGRHFMDSGGEDGRQWQRNQGKSLADFEAEPEQSFSFDHDNGWIMRDVSVFHYLTGGDLELDGLCKEFNTLQDEADNCDANADLTGVSREAWDHLNDLADIDILRSWNTYNGDSDLSQVLRGVNIEVDGEPYLLIEVHGGADIRGGYTAAKLFKSNEDGIINECLTEYMEQFEAIDHVGCGYVETIADYWNKGKTYNVAQVAARFAELQSVES